ncbi:hypothetical protein Y1Q_0011332 [Alligator mississippiensis]|uniref:Uncharacterized protein n=1 Tax=Alligator mississippiensis TaxID=8496 RepID=A0A151N876_ALLMI|nr:hypothetical protein Y1Q_0011332 [Alligator mississippiensis]
MAFFVKEDTRQIQSEDNGMTAPPFLTTWKEQNYTNSPERQKLCWKKAHSAASCVHTKGSSSKASFNYKAYCLTPLTDIALQAELCNIEKKT